MAKGFHISIDAPAWKKADGALERLRRLRLTPLHEEIGEYMVGETADRFRESKDPEGQDWPKLKKPRRRRGRSKRERRIKLLIVTGHLRKSVNARANESRVEVGSNLIYAARHNFGFEKGGKVLTPKRQYLGVSSRNREDIAGIIEDHVSKAVEL